MTSRFEPGFPAPDLPPGWVREGSELRCLDCRRQAVRVEAEREGADAKGARRAVVGFEWRRDPFAKPADVARRCGTAVLVAQQVRAELRREGTIPAAPPTPKPTAADRADAALRDDPDATHRVLAARAGVSARTIARRRRALVEAGEIEPKQRRAAA